MGRAMKHNREAAAQPRSIYDRTRPALDAADKQGTRKEQSGKKHKKEKPSKLKRAKKRAKRSMQQCSPLLWAPEIHTAAPTPNSLYPKGFETALPQEIAAMLTLHGATVTPTTANIATGPTVCTPKVNQDRAAMVCPFAGHRQQALFVVADGHGNKGDFASDLATRALVGALQNDPRMAGMLAASDSDIESAFVEHF